MTKPRQLKTLLFKISCKTWRPRKDILKKFVEVRNDNGFDTWDSSELTQVIIHLIKCRSWMEEETK